MQEAGKGERSLYERPIPGVLSRGAWGGRDLVDLPGSYFVYLS